MDGKYSLIADLDLDIELLKNLKDRKFDQKHFYTTKESAGLYYKDAKVPRPYFKGSFKINDYGNFFRENIPNQKQGAAIISLGCGNANFEKNIFKKIGDKDPNFIYIGVDSSKHMLELAEKELENVRYQKEFIFADFSSYNFRQEINYLIQSYPNRIFALLGETIVNIMPTNIIDTLTNLLNKGDFLWITVVLRKGLSKENDFEIFKHYKNYLDEPIINAHNFYPLSRLGVDIKDGKMSLSMEEESSVGSLRFIYSFKFNKRIEINFRGEKVIILPGEKMELINIRAYDKSQFENFFIEHGFEVVAEQCKGNKGQFLFRKK